MFLELPKEQLLYLAAAFLIGWILSAIQARIAANLRAKKRDPRDDRIRSLEAEARIARSNADKLTAAEETQRKALSEATEGIEKRDNVIAHQQERIEALTADLKASVKKTRELRAELSERATENMRSEAKIREVETELEVAQASTDMLATGVLDYALAPQADDEPGLEANDPDFTKTAT
jgi:septal ring factor EnvC (AmiA/AmiB activator)